MKKDDFGNEAAPEKRVSADQLIKTINQEAKQSIVVAEALYWWMKNSEASQAETLGMLKEQGIRRSPSWLSKRTVMWEHLAVEWQIPAADLQNFDVESLYEVSAFLRKQKKNKDPRALLAMIAKHGWSLEDLKVHLAQQGGGSGKAGKDEPAERVSISKTTLDILEAVTAEVEAKTGHRLGRDKLIEEVAGYAYHALREGEWVPEFEEMSDEEEGQDD